MMHEKRQTTALETIMMAIAWPTESPCVSNVFGVCHVATFSAPLDRILSVENLVKRGRRRLHVQTACSKEPKPAPRASRWWKRDQVSITPSGGLLVAGLISLEDGRLSDRGKAHDAVRKEC